MYFPRVYVIFFLIRKNRAQIGLARKSQPDDLQPEPDQPDDVRPEPGARSPKNRASPIGLRAARPDCRPLFQTLLGRFVGT